MATERAVHVAPGEGPTIQGPAGGPLTFKVRGEVTGGRVTAFENHVAPGDGPPLHRHANEDESWYVIDGRLRFRLGDEEHEAAAGSYVYVPRGVAHAFVNCGDGPARILVTFTPSGMEAFFDAFAQLPDGPIDPAAFRRLGEPVGMEVLGPPLR
jgi:quercetin dioxygenase-like cupin family protein